MLGDSLLKRLTRAVLPTAVWTTGKRVFLHREARRLRDRCSAEPMLPGKVDWVLASSHFRPDQKKSEIVQLLQLLATRRPRHVCEIGGRIGGSVALLAQVSAPDAKVLSMDIDYKPGQQEALGGFALTRQTITCLAADSHRPESVEKVRAWLGGAELDFLLIDGDHSLDGVTKDFVDYAPLVRNGGLIAFHDIVPDSLTRTGVPTGSYAGGVPVLWNNLKAHGYKTEEFIESHDQDGFGLGILYWEGPATARHL